MARQDFTNKASHIKLYQDTITATPSAPTALDVSPGLKCGILITAVPGVTLDATDRIDFVGKKGATAAAATDNMVSADIGGAATISSGIIASFQSDAAALAGVFIPYVGDPSFITVVPTMEGTHGTASEICITIVNMDLENK